MKAWLGSFLLLVSGTFALASGCGIPEVARQDNTFQAPDASVGGDSGSGGTGGGFSFGDGGATTGACPSTCADLNANCGFVTDTLCGGFVECGKDCPAGQFCGGDGASRCGTGTGGADAGACTPSTCDELKANCGAVSDPKCGGIIQCGACGAGESCGLGGPNVCGAGDGGSCVIDPATTCAGRGFVCGQAADNCGNVLDCGSTTCPVAGQSCIQGVCTTPICTVDPKTTCAGRGYTCGQAADNCGHLLICGATACPTPGWTCGGGGTPGVCGCTGVCSQIPTCPSGTTTTVTGKVYDPAGRNPLYHVLVYVANNPADPALASFPKGTTCDVCGASAAGSPLISDPAVADPPAGTYTGVDGTFTLKNVPVGTGISVVIQLGRWRRVFAVNVNNSCAVNPIPDQTLLMPSKQSQGNIPLMAMMTGNADSLECVLRKMGIDGSEFTDPAQGGRVQFYLGAGNSGQLIDAATPSQAVLFSNGPAGTPVINDYDMAILACQGSAYAETAADQVLLRKYADAGGRVFATHYSYTWLYQNNANAAAPVSTVDNWSEVAKWHVDENDRAATAVGVIDKLSNPKANAFQGWLEAVGASVVGSGTTNVVVIRHDTDLISAVPGQTQQWLYRAGGNARHCVVGGNSCTGAAACSNVCSVRTQQACATNADCNAMVCQGRTQTACAVNADCMIGGTNRGPCVPNTCTTPGTCGGFDYTNTNVPLHFTFNTPVNLTEDLTKVPPAVQCGRVLFSDFHVDDAAEHGLTFPAQCGKACTTNANCTGACTGGKCPWGTACTTNAQCASTCAGGRCLDPMNAQEKLLEFMIFDLGSCVPPPKACVPAKLCPVGQECGYAPDGCNGPEIPCGDCPTGTFCGVGQPPVANKCGTVTCAPGTQCPAGQECGFASDGCNGIVACGTCPAGQTCSGGKCGSAACPPKSCIEQGIECGQAGDNCGKEIQCPACPAADACIAGKCVPRACPPQTCADQGFECGPAADGCGQKIDSCGTCAQGDLCIQGKCVQVN